MKVLQLIDSLHAGGAERVAVNYANALSHRIEASYLCATREEGVLKESSSSKIGYLFLNKKATVDFKAILRLYKFIKTNRIDVVHAHSTSYFLAAIVKILKPTLVLIWHDHYGNSEFLNKRPKLALRICSLFFNHVFAVNTRLAFWAKKYLNAKSVSYLPNFAVLGHSIPTTKLKGAEGNRIVCLANLRPQKDHINLLKAFNSISQEHPDWTLHLVGQDFNDAYSKTIKAFIADCCLSEHVFLYGSCPDTLNILNQATIGVLSSKSEGLPLALLEYGLAGKAVVATNVGDCQKVISTPNEGMLVEPERDDLLASALSCLIEDEKLRASMGLQLKRKVETLYSENAVMDEVTRIYKMFVS